MRDGDEPTHCCFCWKHFLLLWMLLHTEPLLPPALPLLAHLLSLLILLMVSRSQLVSWDTPVCVCVFVCVCLRLCVCVWGGGQLLFGRETVASSQINYLWISPLLSCNKIDPAFYF